MILTSKGFVDELKWLGPEHEGQAQDYLELREKLQREEIMEKEFE
jgi:hypothetical protein